VVALAGVAPVAHGGVWGAIGEVAVVFLGLAVFGFFLWRASKKEKSNRSDDPGE
jgi:hypothetical protein